MESGVVIPGKRPKLKSTRYILLRENEYESSTMDQSNYQLRTKGVRLKILENVDKLLACGTFFFTKRVILSHNWISV